MNIFKFIGAMGLILISIGVITQKRKSEDVLYIIGGICLEIYSIYLGDVIFIVLQIIFTVSAIFHYLKKYRRR